MRTNATIVSPLALLVTVSACTPPSGDPTPTQRRDSPTPAGTVWHWSALTGAESLQVNLPGRYTLELMEDGSYDVRADCNTGGGSYTRDGDRLSLAPGPMTLAACGPESLGDRYVALLGNVAGFSRDGDRLMLELGDGAGAMEFVARKPIDLPGTSWLVHAYNNGKGGVVTAGHDATLHVTFTEDGVLAGSSGCNNFKGSYRVEGQVLEIGPLASTRKMCAGDGVMEQEAAFLAALATAEAWEARGERLQLRRGDGALAIELISAVTGTVTED